jgi:hypothetical protein
MPTAKAVPKLAGAVTRAVAAVRVVGMIVRLMRAH